jgi:hypothetical protein
MHFLQVSEFPGPVREARLPHFLFDVAEFREQPPQSLFSDLSMPALQIELIAERVQFGVQQRIRVSH